jgi:hypothetical protein
MNYPEHWIPGALLDLKRFTDGSYRCTLLGETYDGENGIEFTSATEAQEFVSTWYALAALRDQVVS